MCVYQQSSNYTYDDIPVYSWKNALVHLIQIRKVVEHLRRREIDYVLIHIYEDVSDYIGWHNDREALKTPIVSVSLGESRLFKFRRIGKTKGCDDQYLLQSGDVLLMHGPTEHAPGCQEVYKHAIPSTKKKLSSRINLTFRCFD